MKKLYIIPALLLLFSGFISSQENSEEVVEVSTVEASTVETSTTSSEFS